MRFAPYALPEAALASRLRDLTWRFRKWDTHVRGKETTARGALILTRAEHEAAVRAAETLFQASQDAMARWVADADATRALGVPPALVPLAGAPTAARVTRVDLHLTADGWRASEWNDDAPGGYNDALGLVALFADCVEKGLDAPGDLPDALLGLIAPPGTRRVGLAYATGYAEDLQVVRLLADLLESRGVETVLGSPAHLEHDGATARLAGEEIGSLYRFFPAEWFPELPNLDAWARAGTSGLRVVNPLACAWTQSKASFALLDDPRARGLVPRTVRLDRESAREALADKDRFVLKPCFGRMGEGVVMGAERPHDEWRKAIDGALRRREGSVLQERFAPTPVEIAPGVGGTACVGAYVIEGRFAGYYSRVSRQNVVRYDASNLLTLLEAV